MNRDDIIRMAIEAGFSDREESCHMFGRSRFDEEICVEEYAAGEMVERFAALVAAHEREQCARVCENIEDHDETISDTYYSDHYAKAIRARGEK